MAQPKKPRRPNKQPGSSPKRKAGAQTKSRPAVASPRETEVTPKVEPANAFPIVGIGASAGGLEALEAFLKNTPEHGGMAFVVIQHLDPTHKGAMVELLQRATPLPVIQVKDNQKVEPDHVYVIPPGKDISILHRVLHLMPQIAPRGLNLPIDGFFRSLAEDQQERSIGVVLSGMGSDGTLGLRAIKENAGASFVQSPSSAKFDGMPTSAIDAGLADVVAPVEELPSKIIAYRQHTPFMGAVERDVPQADKSQSALEKVFILLRAQTGNDFSLYKRTTVYRRIERRMALHQIDRIGNYVRYLKENPKETDLLFKELLIGVTSFFRDPAAWEHLAKEVLPPMLGERRGNAVIRAWVPGCSTGEEAYSLAIVFKEALEKLKAPANPLLQIFATDLDRDAIEKARQGLYPTNIAADVSPQRLRRFFFQEERGYRVSKDIREMVVFAPQNVIMDPPFTKLDILSCRNLLIYLSPELQKRLVPLFHYSLNSHGVLFLGSAESIGAFSSLFAALDGRTRIYRRLESAGAPAIDFPPSSGLLKESPTREADIASPAGQATNLQVLADRVLVQRFAPAGVLTTEKGDILYTSGRTGKYLEPAVGKANLNIFAMAREGLRFDLNSAFTTALRQERPVTVRGVKVGTNGGTQALDITVQRLDVPKELRGSMMIVFSDVPAQHEDKKTTSQGTPTRHSARLVELERELQRAREEIQTVREEMQTSQEELKSTNEEFQSTNEELQSTNEELTTSKEEMQSLNEELQTVNHELTAKVDELSRSNNDMKNLLNSTDIATLFLDSDLNVRRFTTQTARIIKLIPGDAGRPITDLVTELDYPSLNDDAREVLRTLIFKEATVSARDGHWYTVRIMPYRTLENVIDGLVITFTDATSSKQLEKALREQASEMRQLAESLPNLIWTSRPDGTVDYLSRQWIDYTGISEGEQLGFGWLQVVHPDERERVRRTWTAAMAQGGTLQLEYQLRSRDGLYRWFKAHAVPSRSAEGRIIRWYGNSTDVDDLKRAEEEKTRASEQMASILEGLGDAFLALDENLTITYLNGAAERALDRKREELVGKPYFDSFPEARGSVLEEQYRKALSERVPLRFEAHFDHTSYGELYSLQVYPHAAGISVVFHKGRDGRPQAGEDGKPSQ